MFTFALTGRGVIGCGGLPRVSLRLPWAEEAIGLSARIVNSAIRQSHAARILSHAENLSMRARFSGHAPKGQKFIAQGKRSDALDIMCRRACAL